jgi:membrane-associated protease RseP (regulator of RpoE activity)
LKASSAALTVLLALTADYLTLNYLQSYAIQHPVAIHIFNTHLLSTTIISTIVPLLAYFQTYLVFWFLVCLALWLTKAESHGFAGAPFYLIWRTIKFNNIIERIASARRTAWQVFWNIGIAVGIGSMAFISYYLGRNLLNLFAKPEAASSVQFIVPLPGVGVTFETFPYLVLALSITIVSHELSHGIASLVEHVPLKSTGAFFAHIIMGGFVEPNDEKLNAARSASKLRVFAAGSFTNVVLGLLCVLLLVNFPGTIAPFYTVVASGVTIGDVPVNLPAHSSGLQSGDRVTSINGTRITNVNDLRNYMADVVPGQGVVVGTPKGNFTVKTGVDPTNASHAVIGIAGLVNDIEYHPKAPFLPTEFPNILLHAEYWLQLILVSVGMINMLPLPIFDGEKLLETALNVLGIAKPRGILRIANAAALGILALNMLLSFARFGFVKF